MGTDGVVAFWSILVRRITQSIPNSVAFAKDRFCEYDPLLGNRSRFEQHGLQVRQCFPLW